MAGRISTDVVRINSLLREFVDRNSNIVCIQWDRGMYPRLQINPYSKNYKDRCVAAHYLLLVASILEYDKIIGRAENARKLLIYLYKKFGSNLFRIIEAEKFRKVVEGFRFYSELKSLRILIPDILASVNRFVKDEADGCLIKYSQGFRRPEEMVEQMARHILRMGGSLEDKSWVYMRWMVRPYPDLRIFRHFSYEDLYVPLTTNVAAVAKCLDLIDEFAPSLWKDPNRLREARRRVTSFARRLFPWDPARVDYPFFLLGRWLKGKDLNITTLRDALLFFDRLYKMTGIAHVVYQTMRRRSPSRWEKKIRKTLSRMDIPYMYEPERFPLERGVFYTPDFILPKHKVEGKRIILEPHGRMTRKDVYKFTLFRRIYGDRYFFILILRGDDIRSYRVRGLLPDESYDDVWPIEYIHILLDKIRNGQYTPQSCSLTNLM